MRMRWPVRVAAVALSALLFAGTFEIALRIVYRDAGRHTLGGPGGGSFEHLTLHGDQRGRLDMGERRPGVSRLMVVGDSITYGQGVRDWHDAWPEQLAQRLEAAGAPVEMAVFARPGRDIAQHLEQLERWGSVVQPDVLLYQWYVNDIEIRPNRPDLTRTWQRWPTHSWLRSRSYGYFFLDNRLAALTPPPGRSYVDYVLQDFAPGTAEWAEFERTFHAFAMHAMARSPRRVLILYPQVPFSGAYPLQPLHDRMRSLAGRHTLTMPPASWIRSGGTLVGDPAAPWTQSLHVPAALQGPVVDTGELIVLPGILEVELLVSVTGNPADLTIGAAELRDVASGAAMSSQPIVLPAPASGHHPVKLRFEVPGDHGRRASVRVRSNGAGRWTLASIGVAVDYGMEVVDLTETLNTLNTHASLFDAHPNEAAHRVIADAVARALGRDPSVSGRWP
jgi:lysophospholipase L1-like esterase